MSKSIIKAFLCALGYTPSTLAVDLDTNIRKAQRILGPKGAIYANEAFEIAQILGISINTLCGCVVPGEVRVRRLEQEGGVV